MMWEVGGDLFVAGFTRDSLSNSDRTMNDEVESLYHTNIFFLSLSGFFVFDV